MRVAPGTQLGPYEILAPIGAGGMGEVYRARDMKLNRDVAIKVLPESFANDSKSLARFEHEARMLASLNHPNIATVHAIEQGALVMELVEGENLHGPIPPDESIAIALQIAEGLRAAHEHGIVHRDLKPSNIKITPEGSVKLLDFGLARTASGSGETSGGGADAPTRSLAMTDAGTIVGTVGYMSPEQARGLPIDHRSDIWSFGVVLHELVEGAPLFRGETHADILAEVLGKDPDLSALPNRVRFVVEHCLRKDARKRWQSIADVQIALQATERESGSPPPPDRRPILPWAVAGVSLAIAAGALFAPRIGFPPSRTAPPAADRSLIRLDANLGPAAELDATYAATRATISPDGRRLIYSARTQDGKHMLVSRLLDSAATNPIPGTESSSDPFFSPDGRWIGFFSDGKLKKLALGGGTPVTLAAASNPRGGAWGEDGTIIAALTNTAGLSRISSDGGSPQPVTQLVDGEVTHRWPQMTPGGESVIFTSSKNVSDYENARVEIVALKSGERRVLQPAAYFGRYSASGHLLYVHGGALYAVPMTGAGEIRGAPIVMLDDVASSPTSAAGQFDVSRTGVFLYYRGKAESETWNIALLGAGGAQTKLPRLSKAGGYFTPRFSPDGRRLAIAVEEGKGIDLYSYDFQSDSLSRLTFSGHLCYTPVWSPDGRYVVYSADRRNLFRTRSDGGGETQKLLGGDALVEPHSMTPDGGRLAFHQQGAGMDYDIWTVALDVADEKRPRAGKAEPFVNTSANEIQPAFSPDGRWIAFASDESGLHEIYVRPFPAADGGGKWQISQGGGKMPAWSRKGLFFENSNNQIMVASYETAGDSFVAGKPRVWADQQLAAPTLDTNFAVAPDGGRVAALVARSEGDGGKSLRLTFLVNFFEEVRRKAAGGR